MSRMYASWATSSSDTSALGILTSYPSTFWAPGSVIDQAEVGIVGDHDGAVIELDVRAVEVLEIRTDAGAVTAPAALRLEHRTADLRRPPTTSRRSNRRRPRMPTPRPRPRRGEPGFDEMPRASVSHREPVDPPTPERFVGHTEGGVDSGTARCDVAVASVRGRRCSGRPTATGARRASVDRGATSPATAPCPPVRGSPTPTPTAT